MTERIVQKVDTFVKILQEISQLSTSSRLKVGAIAVHKKFQKISSFGYNGSYPGAEVNPDTGTEEDSLEPGKSGFIHAEINMIAKFREHDPENYIVLLTHSPCSVCTKVLMTAGFRYIYWVDTYRETDHLCILGSQGILYGNIEKLYSDYANEIGRDLSRGSSRENC
jgi:dCMP deaminase